MLLVIYYKSTTTQLENYTDDKNIIISGTPSQNTSFHDWRAASGDVMSGPDGGGRVFINKA
jgi:hypothetical protein